MDRNIGQKIDGRYEITELIGIGGMADVYKATDIMENKTVAVKILKTEFAGNEDFIRRFRNESKAIAVLSHPNIVKIFDVGFTDKIQYIVMEYIDGITLKEFMEQQSVLKWKDAIHFTIQILRALQHAHDRGIVHRDIKPQNIMLFPDGTIKVMDFGIARFSRVEGKTLSDKTIGSVHYISPEQARGDITDEKSDIYSVGAMLYEMLTGKKPFEADTPVAVALMHMQDAVVPLKKINEAIPEGLEEIVLHAMQKSPANRYQSASEMIKDIEIFKANPTVVFGYSNKMVSSNNENPTIFFKPLASSSVGVEEEAVDDEEYYEEEEKSSLIIPVLTGVTVGVVVIVAIIICTLLIKINDNKKNGDYKVPKLIGMSYSDAKKEYGNKFKFTATMEYSAEYDEGIIFEQSPSEGRLLKNNGEIKIKVSKGKRQVEVPDVKNKTFDNAKAVLEEKGFKVVPINVTDESIPKDSVVKTDPPADTKAAYGSEISVYISQGPLSSSTIVPKVEGMQENDAMKLLQDKYITGKPIPISSDKPAGTVVSQSVAPNTSVAKWTEVIIRVSSGKLEDEQVTVELPMGKNAKGSFIITGYNTNENGKQIGSVTVTDKASKISIPLTGKGSNVTVIFEVSSVEQKQNGPKQYARVTIDFINKKYSNVQIINANAFAEASRVAEQSTPDSSATDDSQSPDAIPVKGND